MRRPGAPGLYADLLALCRAQGLLPRVVAEVNRMMTNLNLVAAGVGVSYMQAQLHSEHEREMAELYRTPEVIMKETAVFPKRH